MKTSKKRSTQKFLQVETVENMQSSFLRYKFFLNYVLYYGVMFVRVCTIIEPKANRTGVKVPERIGTALKEMRKRKIKMISRSKAHYNRFQLLISN